MPPLSCFTRTAIPHTGFVSRLLGRKPKEHGFLEIQNLLAQRAPEELSAADVENILSTYEISRPQATPRVKQIYRTAVQHLASDDELSEEDRATLTHLRYVLGLEDSDADDAQNEVLRDLFRARLKKALDDAFLSDDEKSHLGRIAKSFGLPETARDVVYKDEVLAVVQQAFNDAVADQRLTDEEERHLTKMSENLGVKITQDVETQTKVARFRLLAEIESGRLPIITTPLVLPRGEVCHAQLPCRLQEKRTITKLIRYSGPTGRVRIMKGLSWRYGAISVNRVTSEELRQIDSGTLYITNKRLLFNGAAKNLSVPFKKIVQFTVYKDSLQIEKESGRDQYFIGSDDIELIGAILESHYVCRVKRETGTKARRL